MPTFTIDLPGLNYQLIIVHAESTVELVTHEPVNSANVWYALLIDGRFYDLVMWKHTIGRPEHLATLDQALTYVQTKINTLQESHPCKP